MKESQTKGKPLRAKKVFSTEKFSFNKENTGKLRYTEQLSIAFCQLRLKNISPCKDVNLKQQHPTGMEKFVRPDILWLQEYIHYTVKLCIFNKW